MNTTLRLLKLNRKGNRIGRLLLSMLLLFTLSNTAKSQSGNIIINPAVTNVAAGATFSVTVRVDMLSGVIDAAEVHVDFDNTRVTVQSIAVSAGMPLGITAIPLGTVGSINAAGHIEFAAGTAGPGFPAADFDLLDITFLVNPAAPNGATGLTFGTVFPHQSDLQRIGASALNAITNGTVNITAACTPPTATITSGSTCNGQPFGLLLEAGNATGTAPFDLVINGVTYNDVTPGPSAFTTFVPPTQSIFPATSPTSGDEVDAPVTLGVKFQALVDGFAKGIRFFSSAAPTGTYTGQLWDDAGTLLASGTFVGVVGDSWNTMTFTTPVFLTSGITYVASYTTSTGAYTSTLFGLAGNVTNAANTLRALSSGSSGGNGVYEYSDIAGIAEFPEAFFNDANYWADVLFTPANYAFNLTSITGDDGCNSTGAPLQTLNVTSITCVGLPVELLSLSANATENKITVRWSTASESNNKGFEIQRSANGTNNWQAVGYVQGSGTTTSQKDYSFVDANLQPRRYYYQLKQIDFDNNYKLSKVVSASINGRITFSLEQNFPNPFRTEATNIRFTLPQSVKVTLSVFDINGKLVKTLLNATKEAGTYLVPFNAGSLSSGIYYYRIQAGDFTDVKKMTIQ